MAIVTLLSDFGTVDGYVGAMKGVILTGAPQTTLVDLTHDIPAQDVFCGAWALRDSAPFFPAGTIHLAVVDPGVGTERHALLMRARGQLFVGPDNGLLSLATSPEAEAWLLDKPELFRREVSHTFHGRDIFAKVTAHLAAGFAPEQCGSTAEDWHRLSWPEAVRAEGTIRGQVILIDHFGNLVTNIPSSLRKSAQQATKIELADRTIGAIQRTFADVAPGSWVAYWGSRGLLEIAVRDGSAAQIGGYKRGVRVNVSHI